MQNICQRLSVACVIGWIAVVYVDTLWRWPSSDIFFSSSWCLDMSPLAPSCHSTNHFSLRRFSETFWKIRFRNSEIYSFSEFQPSSLFSTFHFDSVLDPSISVETRWTNGAKTWVLWLGRTLLPFFVIFLLRLKNLKWSSSKDVRCFWSINFWNTPKMTLKLTW